MIKRFRSVPVFIMLAIVIGACASPAPNVGTQPSSSDQVATIVAMTLQAVAPEFADTPTSVPEESTNLLPHSLYFLGKDKLWISQIYRMERDGKTVTPLTFESVNVSDYDVSMADGSIAYEVNNQLVLVNAEGSNRRVLVEGYRPVFSPDGRTLAYAKNGLNLYDLSTGVSKLVLADLLSGDSINGVTFQRKLYSPDRYSPDGMKLLIEVGNPSDSPSTMAIYSLANKTLVQVANQDESLTCCAYGGAEWSADSSSFYAVASVPTGSYQSGELWKVDAGNGAVTRMLNTGNGTMNIPKEPYLAPNGHLYFFFGSYGANLGFFYAPVLKLVRSAPDGVTDRTVLRDENYTLMEEALWAPDASFVIVASPPEQGWDQGTGVLELYYTDGQKSVVWLARLGGKMKWGP